MSDDAPEISKWPEEIWMAELDEHHNGTGMIVLSEFATVPRWEGDDERDCNFQRYVDADIHESAERYYKGEIAKLRAAISMMADGTEIDTAMRLQGVTR
jgi:hypothetical protein